MHELTFLPQANGEDLGRAVSLFIGKMLGRVFTSQGDMLPVDFEKRCGERSASARHIV